MQLCVTNLFSQYQLCILCTLVPRGLDKVTVVSCVMTESRRQVLCQGNYPRWNYVTPVSGARTN